MESDGNSASVWIPLVVHDPTCSLPTNKRFLNRLFAQTSEKVDEPPRLTCQCFSSSLSPENTNIPLNIYTVSANRQFSRTNPALNTLLHLLFEAVVRLQQRQAFTLEVYDPLGFRGWSGKDTLCILFTFDQDSLGVRRDAKALRLTNNFPFFH